MHQGMIAIMNSMIPWPLKLRFNRFVVPWTVFTEPQISCVGLMEKDLKDRSVRYETIVVKYEDYGAAIAELELSSIAKSKNIVRVPGSAVCMVATPKGTPLALLHHLKANKCLQKTAVLLTILTEEVPSVPDEDRLTLEHMGEGVWRAVGRYGYMESPDVARLLERIRCQGVALNLGSTTFYFNREMIITGGNARMFEWQKRLYAFLSRNARQARDYYQLPPMQIIEVGLPIQL
jgi:KUP system potassium uptake protein